MDGLSSICNGLGILDEDDDGNPIGYAKGAYCSDNLKDLLRFLRRDDPEKRDVFKQVCKWNIVGKDLIPIIEYCQEDRSLVLNAVKVLVFLTMPVESTSVDIPQQIEYLWGLKSAITFSDIIPVIVSLLESPLENLENESFTEDDWKLVQLVLTFFRNILAIQDVATYQIVGGSTSQFMAIRDGLLEILFKENVMDLILALSQHTGGSHGHLRQDNLLLLEIFHNIFKGQDPELIAKASLKGSKVDDANDDSVTGLQYIIKEEKEKRKLTRFHNLSCYSRLNGTFTRVSLDGSKALLKGNPSASADNLLKAHRNVRGPSKKEIGDHGVGELPPPTKNKILILLADFMSQFLMGGYNVLMQSIREDIVKELQEILDSDVITFFKVAQFVTSFQYHKCLGSKAVDPENEASTASHDDSTLFKGNICGPIAETLNESMFLMVISKWRYAFEGLKQTNDYKFLSAAGSLVKTMIRMLDLVLKQSLEDSKEPQTARVLLYKLFYDQTEEGMTHFLLNLIKSFDAHKQSKSDLANLLESMHVVLRLLENLQARGSLRVSKKARKKKTKKNGNVSEPNVDSVTPQTEVGGPTCDKPADVNMLEKETLPNQDCDTEAGKSIQDSTKADEPVSKPPNPESNKPEGSNGNVSEPNVDDVTPQTELGGSTCDEPADVNMLEKETLPNQDFDTEADKSIQDSTKADEPVSKPLNPESNKPEGSNGNVSEPNVDDVTPQTEVGGYTCDEQADFNMLEKETLPNQDCDTEADKIIQDSTKADEPVSKPPNTEGNKPESSNGNVGEPNADDVTPQTEVGGSIYDEPTDVNMLEKETLPNQDCDTEADKIIQDSTKADEPVSKPPNSESNKPEGSNGNNVDNDDLYPEVDDSSGDEQVALTDEVDFKVSSLVSSLASNSIIQKVCWLLKFYKTNSITTNHYIITILRRICDDLELSPMLYQLSLLTIFSDILEEQSSRPCKEHANLVTFLTTLVRRMLRKMKDYPLLFVEVLFWKTRKECHYINCGAMINELKGMRNNTGEGTSGTRNDGNGLFEEHKWVRRSIADALGDDDFEMSGQNGLHEIGPSGDEFQNFERSSGGHGTEREGGPEKGSDRSSKRGNDVILTDEMSNKLKDLYQKYKDYPDCCQLISGELHPNGEISSMQVSKILKRLGFKVSATEKTKKSSGENSSKIKPTHTRKRALTFNADQEQKIRDLFEQFKAHRRCSYMIANALDDTGGISAVQISRRIKQLGLIRPKNNKSDSNMKLRDEDLSDHGTEGTAESDDETLLSLKIRGKQKRNGSQNDERRSKKVAQKLPEEDMSDDEPLSSMLAKGDHEKGSDRSSERGNDIILTDEMNNKLKDLYQKYKDYPDCCQLISGELHPNGEISSMQVSKILKQLGFKVPATEKTKNTSGDNSSKGKPMHTRKRAPNLNADQQQKIRDLFEQFKAHRRCSYMIANALDETGVISAAQISRKIKQLGLIRPKNNKSDSDMKLRDEESDDETLLSLKIRGKQKRSGSRSDEKRSKKALQKSPKEDMSDDEPLSSMLAKTKGTSDNNDELMTDSFGKDLRENFMDIDAQVSERNELAESTPNGASEDNSNLDGSNDSEMETDGGDNLKDSDGKSFENADDFEQPPLDDDLADFDENAEAISTQGNSGARRRLRMVLDFEDDE